MELVNGKGGKGSVEFGGLTLDLIRVDPWVYVKGNPPLMRRLLGTSAADKLRGRWLKEPSTHGPLAPLAELADLQNLVGGTLTGHHQLSRAGLRTIDGQRALALADNVERATLYVAAHGTPYPLAIVGEGPGAGRLDFARWNQEVSLEGPPSAVNIAELGR
jgi:hypothetical protein